jgi:hypothetical protein
MNDKQIALIAATLVTLGRANDICTDIQRRLFRDRFNVCLAILNEANNKTYDTNRMPNDDPPVYQ